MNATLILSLWRQRLTSPVRLVALAALLFGPLLLVAFIRDIGFRALGDVLGLTMVFAIGMIGHDVSSGVLQLVFARPVRRWEYVLSRWLAVATGASAVVFLQIALATTLMSLRGSAPGVDEVATFALGRVIDVFGVAAVMTLLSSLIGGAGDIAVYAMLMIGGGIVMMIGQATGSDAVAWIGRQLGAFMQPHFEPAQLVTGAISWHAITSYFSTLSLCLLLAITSVNRKELSYASG